MTKNDLIYAVNEIKSKITIADVLRQGGFLSVNKKRIQCPIHRGKDFNFAFDEKRFMCFSRCGSGDVISLVQKLYGLDFVNAVKKIDADFALGLFRQRGFEKIRSRYYSTVAKNAIAEKRERLEAAYSAALDEFVRFDKLIMALKPPKDAMMCIDDLHPFYVAAVKQITFSREKLNIAEVMLYEFEHTANH